LLQLKYELETSIGFLPNGDLIIIDGYKIYWYPFKNKPINATLWKYSQIYDIEFHEKENHDVYCFVRQTKLFLFNNKLLIC